MKRPVEWTISELVEVMDNARKNNLDNFILITGATGTGKTTLAIKILNRFPDFNLKEHITYRRDYLIELIKNNKDSYALADEMISVGNKRKFYNIEQIELVEILTKMRSNRNIFIGCLPIFFSLDKELLKLVSMHIQVAERGLAIIHMPIRNRIFNDDIWDLKINQKKEESWSNKRQKKPTFKTPYWEYSTYVGHVRFGKLGVKQEKEYEELKEEGRVDKDIEDNKTKEKFNDKVFRMLLEGNLDEDKLFLLCQYEGKKLSSVRTTLGIMLKDKGETRTVKNFLKDTNNNANNSKDINNNSSKIILPKDL